MTVAPWLRAATPDDALAMGRVAVAAWQVGYAELLPADALAVLDAAQRASFWHDTLMADLGRRRVVVAQLPDGVAGFAAFGPENAPELTDRGELYAMNVDPAHWGCGIGTRLLAAAGDGLAADGYREAVLWVLPGNARARGFYARHGWVAEPVTRDVEAFGVQVTVARHRRSLP